MGAYASSSDVAAFCSNLITGASDFSASTVPTQSMVEHWISAASAMIDNSIGSRGFSPPTDATSDAWLWLRDLCTYYATGMAEMARSNVRLAPGERTRGQQFMQMWKDGMKEIRETDISATGLTYANRGYVGGISVSDKESVVSDSDRESMRFSREMFDNPKAPAKGEGGQRTSASDNSIR